MNTKKIHISLVKAGDTVLCLDGFERTLGPEYIKKGFMGTTIWGDSYKLGTILVTVLVY